MSRISIERLATFGLVLGAFIIGRLAHAEEQNGTTLAPPKASSAAAATAASEKPADTAAKPTADPSRNPRRQSIFGFDGSPGNAQPSQPAEPLSVLKSGPNHTRIVYRLRSTPVTSISSTITRLFRQEGDLTVSAGTAAKNGPALRVAIAVEPVTNSLVISGPPDAVDEVKQLVEKMDQPAPMVQFEVELGEAVAGDAKHVEEKTAENNATPAEKPEPYQILARPKSMVTIAHARLLTLDNQPAFVQLGQRVPRITGVSRNSLTGTTHSLTMDNTGTILAVTPRINVKDGKVVLQVDAEDSQAGPEDEGIALSTAGEKVIRSPRIDALTVQTTVAVRDGATTMLGSISRRGKNDKELIVILTAHIIPPDDGKAAGH